MTPVIRITGSESLLSAVPVVLGFHPTDSVVLACLQKGRKLLGPIARVDLALYWSGPDALAEQLAFSTRGHADHCVLVFYGLEVDPFGFDGMLANYGMSVVHTVFTGNEPHELHAMLHAESVLRGKVIADDREALRARVEFNDTAGIPPDQTILTAMRDSASRDEYLAANISRAQDVLPHILATCRRIADPAVGASTAVVANLCAVAGILAYRVGDGNLTQVCLDRAYRIDPSHRLSHVMNAAIAVGTAPEELDGLMQDPSAAKHYLFKGERYDTGGTCWKF
jgi:hypothetical protein